MKRIYSREEIEQRATLLEDISLAYPVEEDWYVVMAQMLRQLLSDLDKTKKVIESIEQVTHTCIHTLSDNQFNNVCKLLIDVTKGTIQDIHTK